MIFDSKFSRPLHSILEQVYKVNNSLAYLVLACIMNNLQFMNKLQLMNKLQFRTGL